MISLSDIDATTTVGELMGALSEGEIGCLRTTLGDAVLQAVQDQPLAEIAPDIGAFPLNCLEEDSVIEMTVAFMFLQVEGVSADTKNCVADAYREHGVPGPAMSETDSMRSFLYAQLCLTDEEAQALSGAVSAENALPLPSQLRCVSEITDLENLIKVYQALAEMETLDEQPAPDPELMMAMGEVMAAQEACGIPTTIGGEGTLP